ncbi:MAG: CaiB/BaiF CoA-transferase family protein [Halofilum sp. (in: g-proteobacteria)]|nr:CaiB/BaiF CoA-transferase family protein [Halofilum sp. (in: g-proteobacteria)]
MTDGALSHLRVLDLSRVLAGPTAGQILADLGAEVIKVERPGRGDDTRHWGPPWLNDEAGRATGESAYFLSANRGKKSVAIDIAQAEGQQLVRDLAARSDILLENFKVGGLARYGLDHESLAALNPRLIHCSITGFGETGPYADRPGYDFLIQGMGGLMSITGEPDDVEGGGPQKVGVALADVMSGLYAVIAVLAALAHRERSGAGQHIDLALLDVQVASLANQAMNYLVSGKAPERLGNAHPNIVPYQAFECADGHFILAVGNDDQFRRLCAFIDVPEIADDGRFRTNGARVEHRQELIPILQTVFAQKPRAHWLESLEAAGIPCGPINRIDEVFADPQVQARGMQVDAPHPLAGTVPLVGSPLKMSATPTAEAVAPPTLGQHTAEVLAEVLDLDPEAIDRLHESGVIA